MKPFVLLAVAPVVRLGVQVGDRIIFDPAAPQLLTRWRPTPLPNIGATLLALEDGALVPAESPTPPAPSALRARLFAASRRWPPMRSRVARVRSRLGVVR